MDESANRFVESYTDRDILHAKRVMLNSLAELSGGTLLAGCCTQGCCDGDGGTPGKLEFPMYSRQDLLHAKRAMLNELASIAGGTLLAGCCTQGCCDESGIVAFINIP